MKVYLLTAFLLLSGLGASAQNISSLPTGKYEARLKSAQKGWDKGDIVIVDDSHYKLTGNGEGGEYRFSVAAQRIFFTSGPLKSAFTKVVSANGTTVIVLPPGENSELGLTAEVWASKQ